VTSLAEEHRTEAARLAHARAGVYGFLGSQWLAPPVSHDRSLEQLTERWRGLGVVSEEHAQRLLDFLGSTDDVTEALESEYQALLKVPAGRYLAPIQSVYETAKYESGAWTFGRLRGSAWFQVTATYERAGYDPAQSDVEADHIGCLLQFLGALCRAESGAWHLGEWERAAELRSSQRAFIETHLSSWLPALRRRLDQAKSLPYYPVVMEIVEAYLQVEAMHLRASET
jgi:TorA maturation chaperone TorD